MVGKCLRVSLTSCGQNARLGIKEFAEPLQKSINRSIDTENRIRERPGLTKEREAASGREMGATSSGGNRSDAQETAQAEQRASRLEIKGH
jgi:hypothetical protein